MTARSQTPERIADIAEELFAKKGFAATSVSEIAARVGISSPGIYKHFANKLAIYEAVCDRLFSDLDTATSQLDTGAGAAELGHQIGAAMEVLAAHPNIARLVQHATLAEDDTLRLLTERWYRKFFSFLNRGDRETVDLPTTMAFHCMILGYVTLAPLHKSIFGLDPLQGDNLQAQLRVQQNLIEGLSDRVKSRKQRG